MVGGAGNDEIWGGPGGADTLTGGMGADRYWYYKGDGNVVITADSANNLDRIEFADATAGELNYALSGNDLVITITGSAGSLTVKDWTLSAGNRIGTLHATDGNATVSLTVMGTAGNDNLVGFAGNDTLNLSRIHITQRRVR